jgi:hypothetical protein
MAYTTHSPAINSSEAGKSRWVLGLLVAFTSSGFVQKYTGVPGLLGYTAVVCALFSLVPMPPKRFRESLEHHFPLFAGAFLIALALIYLGLHHVEDGRGPGRSSDRDEGLEIAVTRLLSGENPYYSEHPVAGPLSLLPGAILLAVPFVLAGSVGLQNIFWLGVFLWICGRRLTNRGEFLSLLAVSLAASPSAQYEIISGGDMIANGAYALCFLILAHDTWTNRDSPIFHKLATAVLLGIGLASRANMIFLLPVLGAFVLRKTDWKQAFGSMTLVGMTYGFIVTSFYLIDPASFTPLKSREKIMFDGETLWWADEAILGLTATVMIVFFLKSIVETESASLRQLLSISTWITITPMIAMVILSSATQRKLDCRFMHDRFGLMYLCFAIAAAACHAGTGCSKRRNGRQRGECQ